MAADHVDGDNVDSVSDDEEIWTRAFSADQDTDQQIKNGNKVNATQMRVMTSEKIMEELDQHSVPTTLVEEGDEMNINNKKSADSMSKTETSKDSIVEVESLRTQVLILPKSTTNHPQKHQLFEITKMFKSSKSTLGCHSGWIRRGSSPPSVRCCPGKNKSSRTSDSDFLCYSRSDKNLRSELAKPPVVKTLVEIPLQNLSPVVNGLELKIQVLGAIVLRISRELGGKRPLDERKRGELGGGGVNMGGGGVNMGAGAEMGGRGSKYEAAEGCTNGGFSGHSMKSETYRSFYRR